MITWRINGETVTKKQWDAREAAGLDFNGACPMGTVAYTESDPLISEGLGCLPNQIPEMQETIHKHNIKGVRVRKDGAVEFTSRQGRKELCRVRGLHDGDGGYGD